VFAVFPRISADVHELSNAHDKQLTKKLLPKEGSVKVFKWWPGPGMPFHLDQGRGVAACC
jgi:hypothetical protein